MSLFMEVRSSRHLGTPFAYHKFKGGLEVDYIGYHLDYFTWTAGISAKRSAWIVEWVSRAEASNWTVVGRQLIEFIGRLNGNLRLGGELWHSFLTWWCWC